MQSPLDPPVAIPPIILRSEVLRANDLAMHAIPLPSRGCNPDAHGAVLRNNIFGFQQIEKRKNRTSQCRHL